MPQQQLDYASPMPRQPPVALLQTARPSRYALTLGMVLVLIIVNAVLLISALADGTGVLAILITARDGGVALIANRALAVVALLLLPAVWRRSGFWGAAIHFGLTIAIVCSARGLINLACRTYGHYHW